MDDKIIGYNNNDVIWIIDCNWITSSVFSYILFIFYILTSPVPVLYDIMHWDSSDVVNKAENRAFEVGLKRVIMTSHSDVHVTAYLNLPNGQYDNTIQWCHKNNLFVIKIHLTRIDIFCYNFFMLFSHIVFRWDFTGSMRHGGMIWTAASRW